MSLKSSVPQPQRIAIAVLIAVLLAAFLPARITRAQAPTPASYTFEECDQVKASTLRDELNRITQAIFEEEQGVLSVSEVVKSNWTALNLDATVDAAVEAATQKVMEETGYWERLVSGWSPTKAEELTKEVANHAFGSSEVRDAFNTLSQYVSDDVVAEIRLITAMSASSALLCVQTFIGDTISPTMSAVLEEEIHNRLKELDTSSDEEIDFLDIAMEKPHLLGGVGIVIASQIAKSLGKKLSQKIAGKVIGRVLGRIGSTVVPVAGWIIGAALIVWDLWKAKEGSLPLIRDALKDDEVKQEIREQTTIHVSEELRLELPQLARAIANDVYSQWQEFRRKYARVLDLAESNTRFRGILDRTEVDEIEGLADFVGIIESESGTKKLEELIENGDFERLFHLHEEALGMLRNGVEPEVVIDWANLAGDLFPRISETELYRAASPSDFTDRADLERILILNDEEVIGKVLLLPQDVRETVMELPSDHIVELVYALSREELTQLAKDYLAVLEPRERNILVDRILREPGLSSELGTGVVRGALLGGQDFERRLNYVAQKSLQRPGIGSVVDMFAAIGPALSGVIPLGLFWHYDGRALLNVLYVLAAVIALYIVWRRVFPRRRQGVNVTIAMPGSPRRDGSASEAKRLERRDDDEEDTR